MVEDTDPLRLSEQQKKAGAEFLSAMQKLGLDPECLFWAFDFEVGHHVLLMATSAYELAGPLAISRTIFKAYNASATPKDIDPFVLRFHSLHHNFIRATAVTREHDVVDPLNRTYFGSRDMKWHPDWFYKFAIKKPGAAVVEQRWKRYEKKIERLAA
ncbi:hypothetical protein [Bradyrhizobium sp. 76]|uniref:hypothetical protein n=1 Tax=Bradyrhizobium sp. 76 TaxID=2782680 RepID=UPI001FF800B8|nr:hypothetical protein [Bradyrhizobium sp. 76]MCK1404914.1 hypothetical protein [Bradyrhizobium sp. 76]